LLLLLREIQSYGQPSKTQLQVCGPHVARHRVFNGPRKHSGKIFKYEIC